MKHSPNSFYRFIVAVFVAASALAGCAESTLKPLSHKDQGPSGVYPIAFRQVPPQPVYNRLRFVQLPDVLPARELREHDAPLLAQMVHLHLKNATLEETASVLAATSQYSAYCASTIAKKRITINSLGTVDELADQISNIAGIQVAIDHSGRQIRFLAGTISPQEELGDSPSPRFLDEK